MQPGRAIRLYRLIAYAIFATVLGSPCVQAQGQVPARFPNAHADEAKSKKLCELDPERIHVSTRWGTECIAYFVTKGQEHQRSAVMFIDGDVAVEKFAEPKRMALSFKIFKSRMQKWADRLKVRYVYISRVGVNGSSGNHGGRRKPNETMVLNAAADI